ncbi:hypothetical protein MGYG_08996, partial [Nannizzia gypsea CBS 118893]
KKKNQGPEEDGGTKRRREEETMASKGKPIALKRRSTPRCLHPSRQPAYIQMLSTSTSTSSTSNIEKEVLTTEFDASQTPQPFLDPGLRDRMLKLRGSGPDTAHTKKDGEN